MKSSGEVIVNHHGKQYGATFSVSNGILLLKTHTETRSVELGRADAETLAQDAGGNRQNSGPDLVHGETGHAF